MSKMDAMRAMREARYEQRPAASNARAAAPTPLPRPTPEAAATPPAPAEPKPAEALCGHRSMNGRTCTREQGHAAKSHRYS